MGELLDPVLQHLRCECRAVVESTHVAEAIDHPQMPVVAQVPEVTGAEPSFVVSGSRGAHRVAVVFPEQAGGAHQDLTLRRETELDAIGDRPDGTGPDVQVRSAWRRVGEGRVDRSSLRWAPMYT